MKINNEAGKEYIYKLDKNSKKTEKSGPSNDLDKDAFLKLLTTQLSNQDPLSPMEDREFIAQLAQFSSLEQMTELNKTMEKSSQDTLEALEFMNYNQMKANSMILKEIANIRKAIGAEEIGKAEIEKDDETSIVDEDIKLD